MTAKDEIGNYSVSTSFGGGTRIYHDPKFQRPTTRGEALRQIEATYIFADYDEADKERNCRRLGLEFKPLKECSNDELRIILDDFEKCKEILYEE